MSIFHFKLNEEMVKKRLFSALEAAFLPWTVNFSDRRQPKWPSSIR